ncbi:MAG TPA: hypothetical protein VJP45_10670 [Candidatus Limnocylindria bacterium]|nr:hypothetical protein [Candidatus Limnocylindria bacterium]
MSRQKSYPVLVSGDLIERATAVWHAYGGSATLGGRFATPNDVLRHAAHFGALFVTTQDLPSAQAAKLPAAWRVGFWLETEQRIRLLGFPIASAFRAAIGKGLALYELAPARDSA